MYFRHEKPRPGQEEMMQDWAEVLESGGVLLAHAPCGIGKTDAAISPAIDRPLLFLTPKNSQHLLAFKVATELSEKFSLGLRVVEVVGKAKVCPLAGEMDSETFQLVCSHLREKNLCPYLGNPLPELPPYLFGASLRQRASEEGFCPYEALSHALSSADVVIADYNFFLSPWISPGFFRKLGRPPEKFAAVFDEAHNLPSRATSFLSRSLSLSTVKLAEREWKEETGEELGFLTAFRDFLRPSRKVSVEEGNLLFSSLPSPDELADVGIHRASRERKRSALVSLALFVDLWPEGRAVRYIKENTLVKAALDPSELTSEISSFSSALLMSATLKPLRMYAEILGLEDALLKEYPSPFPEKNRLQLVYPGLTTKYERRGPDLYLKVGRLIDEMFLAVPRSVAAFVPSYEFLDSLKPFVEQRPLFVQTQGMGPSDVDEVGEALRENEGILLAVQGGLFSEGLDLPGIFGAVLVIGLAFEEPSVEVEERIRFYEEKFGKGYEYGYLYPALIKAMQSAGRGIRSEKDKAVLVFADKRFLRRKAFSLIGGGVVAEDPISYARVFFGKRDV